MMRNILFFTRRKIIYYDNIIILHFVDALRGDDKIVPDSMVIDLGAPGFIVQEDNDENDDDGGGGGGGCFMSNISN